MGPDPAGQWERAGIEPGDHLEPRLVQSRRTDDLIQRLDVPRVDDETAQRESVEVRLTVGSNVHREVAVWWKEPDGRHLECVRSAGQLRGDVRRIRRGRA